MNIHHSITEEDALDFSGLHEAKPRFITSGNGRQDFLDAFHYSRDNQVPLTIRGTAHSCGQQSLSHSGILFKNESPSPEYRITDQNTLQISSGSNWLQAVNELNEKGFTLPVMTDYLELSVGGTVSVGGIGVDSIRHGFLVDQINHLTLTLPEKESMVCSRDENSEMFQLAPAGLGQAGFIESVDFKLAPFHRYSVSYLHEHANPLALLEFARAINQQRDQIDHFHGYWFMGKTTTRTGFYTNEPPTSLHPNFQAPMNQNHFFQNVVVDDLLALKGERLYGYYMPESKIQWINRDPNYIRIWSDYFFDFDGAQKFLHHLSQSMNQSPYLQTLKGISFILVNRPDHSVDMGFLPPANRKNLFNAGLYFHVNRWDPVALSATINETKRLLQLCLDCGGYPYLYGYDRPGVSMMEHWFSDVMGKLEQHRNLHKLNDVNPDSMTTNYRQKPVGV